MNYPYVKTVWNDHIVDPVTEDVIQQGTRYTANRMNNIENAIEYLCNEQIPKTEAEFLRIQLELEMLGRSPVNNGTFFDALNGETPKQMIIETSMAILQHAINAGTKSIQLDVVPFSVGEVITIIDEELFEHVVVEAMNDKKITISAPSNAYKKGAKVTRSNTVVDVAAQKLKFGTWGTYTVSVSEVV